MGRALEHYQGLFQGSSMTSIQQYHCQLTSPFISETISYTWTGPFAGNYSNYLLSNQHFAQAFEWPWLWANLTASVLSGFKVSVIAAGINIICLRDLSKYCKERSVLWIPPLSLRQLAYKTITMHGWPYPWLSNWKEDGQGSKWTISCPAVISRYSNNINTVKQHQNTDKDWKIFPGCPQLPLTISSTVLTILKKA